MRYAKIIGTGSYLPQKIVTNTDLAKTLDTTDKWIFERTGIRQRHIANAKETTAFMAIQAANKALEMAQRSTVDMVLVATTTADNPFPSTACLVQAALELGQCPAFDMAAACAGFNYALSIAEQFIRTGQCDHILVIGSETMSRLVDWSDRSTCVLFGDGAGAIVLKASDTPGILGSHLYAEGKYRDLLYVDRIASTQKYSINMQGSSVFRAAISRISEALSHLLIEQNVSPLQLDWLIPHQANIHLMQSVARKLGLPFERVINTIEAHANTSSASIPIALDQAIQKNYIKKEDLMLLESFGGGFAWGATLIRY